MREPIRNSDFAIPRRSEQSQRILPRSIQDIRPRDYAQSARPSIPIQRKSDHQYINNDFLKNRSHETHTKSESVEVTKQIKKKQNNLVQYALISAAAFIFVVGIYATIHTLLTNNKVEAQSKAASNNQTSANNGNEIPNEAAINPSVIRNYAIDPSLPRLITIEKIGLKARIIPLNTKGNNELKAPSNIFDIGWFKQSAKPGENGAMLLDGHVHGPTKKGVFYNLKKLTAGDVIDIERGDSKHFTYKVIKTTVFDKDQVNMASTLIPVEQGVPGLNLITCTGSVAASGNTYSERLVVYTSLVN